MAELPEDVITDILTCTPVKSLLRFRCVSKHVRALIDGPDFIKRHLNRSLETKTNHKLILEPEPCWRKSRNSHLYSVDLDKLDQAREINNPCGTKILGSVNGILCLRDVKKDIVLWNLAMRKYQKLPEILFSAPPGAIHTIVRTIYGFGYDSVSDDYKLFWLVQYSHNLGSVCFYSEAKVYSLRSNSWQRIQDSSPNLSYWQWCGVLACGMLHWVATHNPRSFTDHLIVAFDLAKNEYRQVDCPVLLDNKILKVVNFEGRLCVMCKKLRRMFEEIDVWVMKDYGVKESWSKLFTISQPKVSRLSGLVNPIAISKSGTEIMLLQNNKKLSWYSLKEVTVRAIHLRGSPGNFLPEVCVESLVPLSGKVEDYGEKNGEEDAKEKPD